MKKLLIYSVFCLACLAYTEASAQGYWLPRKEGSKTVYDVKVPKDFAEMLKTSKKNAYEIKYHREEKNIKGKTWIFHSTAISWDNKIDGMLTWEGTDGGVGGEWETVNTTSPEWNNCYEKGISPNVRVYNGSWKIASLTMVEFPDANVAPLVIDLSQGTPFDTYSQESPYTQIIPFANPDGSLEVAWQMQGDNNIKVANYAKGNYAKTKAKNAKGLGQLAGFAKDAQGNNYLMSFEKYSTEEHAEKCKPLHVYKNDQLFWSAKSGDENKCGDERLVNSPNDWGSSRLMVGKDKLAMELNFMSAHAHSGFVPLAGSNQTTDLFQTLYQHTVDNRLFFDGTDFIVFENRDHDVSLTLMKMSPTAPMPFRPDIANVRSIYSHTNVGNNTYCEIGNVQLGVDNGDGYLVLFTSERDWDSWAKPSGMQWLMSPRDLAVVHVRKDFDKQPSNMRHHSKDEYSQAPKMVDNSKVVNSNGAGKLVTYPSATDGWDWANYNKEVHADIESGELSNRQLQTAGVNWLTSFGSKYENSKHLPNSGETFSSVHRPKLVRLSANTYIAIWEEHKVTMKDWVATQFSTTKAMKITTAKAGDKVNITQGAVKDLGNKVRLPKWEDAILLDGKAAWVTGDTSEMILKLYTLDANLNLVETKLDL
jgi:hypothetical protein